MSTVTQLTVKYESNFAMGLLNIAKKNYSKAKTHLKLAAHALNELAGKRSGENKYCTQEWLFDILNEVQVLERQAKKDDSSNVPIAACVQANGQQNNQKMDCRFLCEYSPQTTFQDIAGLDDVKKSVLYKAIYPSKYKELYQAFNKRTGGGILLYGLPGTGKTLIAQAIAHETGAAFFSVKCSDLGSKWFGETEQNIRDVFAAAREAGNAVLFFDEIEAYASCRRENSAMERSVPEFLAQMQGVGASEENNRILIVGATNKPWRLDGAFLRPGRFDEKIYVPLPNFEARRQMFDLLMAGLPVESDVDWHHLATITEGYNGADIDYICEKAKEIALQRLIECDEGLQMLTSEDFAKATMLVKSSVLQSDRVEMEQWIAQNAI